MTTGTLTREDTGSHSVVTETDVTSAATPDTPVQELEHVHILQQHNTALAGRVGALQAEIVNLRAENRELRAELTTLKAHADPLTTPWVPDVDPPTLWTEETLIAHWAAAHRDSYDTHTLVADSHRHEREAVDSLLDYTEQTTTHEPSTVFDDELRALLDEPVEISDKWRNNETRLMVGVVADEYWRTHSVEPSPLDPDVLDAEHKARIAQDSPADVSGQNREATPPTTPERASGRGSGAETSQSPLNGPEDRQPSPPGAHRTLAEVHDGVRRDALTTGEQSAPEPPLVGGWRVWAASAAIGIVGLAATIGALVVWA